MGRLFILLWVCCAGCGSGERGSAASGVGGVAGAGGSAGAATGGSAGQPACAEDHGPDAVCVLRVEGRTVDQAGAPLGAITVSVCGPICWYGESSSTGTFSVAIGERIAPDVFSILPHGRPDRTSFYFELPPVIDGVVQAGDLPLLDLPATGPLLVAWHEKQGAPAQVVTSGGLTLELGEGTQLKLDVEDVALGAAGKQFRALPIPDAVRAAFVDPSLGVQALWALTPFEAAIVAEGSGAPALARLSAANTLGLEAGAAVEWLALGSYLFPDWVKPAAFEVVSSGVVSADGTRIEMNAGEGVQHLTWLGVRKKP